MNHAPVGPRVFVANKGLEDGAQVRVNVRTALNTAKVRREKLNGRDVLIVPSATMPDDYDAVVVQEFSRDTTSS